MNGLTCFIVIIINNLQILITQKLYSTITQSTMETTLFVSNSIPTTASCNPQRQSTSRPCHYSKSITNSNSQLKKFPSLLLKSSQGSRRRTGSGSVRVTCGVTEIRELEFEETVLKSDLPVLVEFVATWCGPCRLMASAIDSVAQEYKDKLTVVKMDHDANPQLIEKYKVYGLPTLILFKNGKEVAGSRREGAIVKKKLEEYVDTMLESISEK